jgi:hypothetical protein
VGKEETSVTNQRRRSIAVAAALAALVVGMPINAAAKKNGKRIKFTRNVRLTAGGTTVAFFAVAQTPAHYGGILRTIAVGCADFPPATIPGTSMFCTSN